MHSVELLLDDGADRAVRANWAALQRAHLPSQGRHTGESNRPHVTVALTESVTDVVRGRLDSVAAGLPVPLIVGGLGVFGGRRFILSRLVVPNRALLDLHQRVLAALDEPSDPHGNLAVGAWTPHVTLGRRFTADQLGAAATALGNLRPVEGAAGRMRVWDIAAHREELIG